MKILQVITSLQVGGAEKLLVDMAPMLRQRGHDVDVLIFYGKETPLKQQLKTLGVKVIEFSQSANVYNPLYILKLKSIMGSYDIVHTHNTSPQYFAAVAKWMSHNQTKLVTTEHSTNNRRRTKSWWKPIDRFMYRQYSTVICISDIARENLLAYLNRKERQVITIPNGVDTQKFMHAQPYCKKELLDIDENAIIITQVAGFREAKDQDTLIRALKLLPQNCHLAFVGDGPRRSLCEHLAEENDVQNRVHFLGIRTDVERILKTSDIIVMSSHWEGLSLSSVEGMCAGKAFMASNVQGLREVVSGAGILFEHSNSQQFADEVKHLISDPSWYNEVASKCLANAKKYDISSTVDGYEQVYLKLKNPQGE